MPDSFTDEEELAIEEEMKKVISDEVKNKDKPKEVHNKAMFIAATI